MIPSSQGGRPRRIRPVTFRHSIRVCSNFFLLHSIIRMFRLMATMFVGRRAESGPVTEEMGPEIRLGLAGI